MSAQPMEPVRSSATSEEAGRNCPYCRFALKAHVEVVRCGACGAVHHADCWDDNGGCSIMGCAGAPPDRATTSALPTPAALTPARPASQAPVPPASVPGVPVEAVAPPPYQPPTPGGQRRSGGLLIGAIVLLAMAIGGVAVALIVTSHSSSPQVAGETASEQVGQSAAGGGEPIDEAAPEPIDTVTPEATGTPEPEPVETSEPIDNGVLPDIPRAQMRRDIRDMLLVWHEDIVAGDFRSAWNMLTERKRRKAERDGGYDEWATGQDSLGRYLDPSGIRVAIQDLDPKTGVARVMVGGMYYSRTNCEWRGITWVRFEDGEWKYDPGYSTTPQREREYKSRFSELLGGAC